MSDLALGGVRAKVRPTLSADQKIMRVGLGLALAFKPCNQEDGNFIEGVDGGK